MTNKDLSVIFDEEVNQALVQPLGLSVAAPAVAFDFCQHWPLVKQGLEFLITVIRNPIAKALIGVLVRVGDRYCRED